jgi:hypothetical protein
MWIEEKKYQMITHHHFMSLNKIRHKIKRHINKENMHKRKYIYI